MFPRISLNLILKNSQEVIEMKCHNHDEFNQRNVKNNQSLLYVLNSTGNELCVVHFTSW